MKCIMCDKEQKMVFTVNLSGKLACVCKDCTPKFNAAVAYLRRRKV